MRNLIKFAPLAGIALLVSACGGGAANNTAAAPVDNGTEIGNDPMAPDMNGGMPVDNNAMAAPTDMNAPAPAMNATNSTNAM
jgi:hypothetical protein